MSSAIARGRKNYLNRSLLTINNVFELESIPLGECCCQLIDQAPQNQTIILDLSQTNFIDSSGVGVLVTIYKAASAKNQQLVLQQVQPLVIKVLDISGLLEVFQLQSVADIISPQGLATHPSVNSKLKRLVDIFGSIIGLLITGLILLPIALAIKLDSPGPIFFSQVRCGWLGRKFRIWKFRSMCIDAESRKSQISNQAQGAFFKNDFDPRVTKVGRFLRRTSLDELPQFWNVLKGDMSLVGTRPPIPEEADQYHLPAWQRLNVKPGMTGEWQVNGRSQIRNFEDVIRLDLLYQKDWNLFYDLKLILKTIATIFLRNNGAV